MADSGFYTNDILNMLKKYNVKPLIAKNVRNSKTKKKTVNKKGKKKKVKLSYAQKIERQLEDMSLREKKLFKKRGKNENIYANYKQIPRFAVGYDRYIKNLHTLSLIYFSEQFLKHL